mmetsp:Transcript_14313/g.35426  ORF Transcript_14313/g.35426 Transcript_14313/m.35426 type:complete len:212 (-) Transcript_14313:316-951(-)
MPTAQRIMPSMSCTVAMMARRWCTSTAAARYRCRCGVAGYDHAASHSRSTPSYGSSRLKWMSSHRKAHMQVSASACSRCAYSCGSTSCSSPLSATSCACMACWSSWKLAPMRSMRAANPQNASDSSRSTPSSGAAMSLIPWQYPMSKSYMAYDSSMRVSALLAGPPSAAYSGCVRSVRRTSFSTRDTRSRHDEKRAACAVLMDCHCFSSPW